MNDSVHDELIRLSLKRELTSDDRARIDACLAAHPELRAVWEEETQLGRALNALPDVPLSSNFAAQVLEAIELEERAALRAPETPSWRRWMRRFQPRLSWALALMLAAGWGVYRYKGQQNAQMAQDVRRFSQELASLPPIEVFQDFDAIDGMRQVSSTSDDELLKVLK